MLGEGKPENQNHAMIFCFGECLQTVDMNQDNRLAEAFKMRNLLTEFDKRAGAKHALSNQAPSAFREMVARDAKRHPIVALVGFREWIFSGKVCSEHCYTLLLYPALLYAAWAPLRPPAAHIVTLHAA